jgi:hypothetical protein
MTTIVVHHHLGIGDHFICNGLVNHLADQHELVHLACKRQYMPTVACLYSDQPRVDVFPVDDEHADVAAFAARVGAPLLRVGFEHCDPSRFDRSFYDQLAIPFEYRFTKFRLPARIPGEDELFALLAPEGPYAVVHREKSYGPYRLRLGTTLPVLEIRGGRFDNLLTYRKLLERAAEIHCINSSVIHLASGIETRARRFYHDVRPLDFELAPGWTTVSYGAWRLRGALARARRLVENWSVLRISAAGR